jgi:peptidoglycan pentaglycine glycine transferase (the first glycine)
MTHYIVFSPYYSLTLLLYYSPVDIRLLTSADDLKAYDTWVKAHPQGTLWQSLEWRNYQKALGRETRIYASIKDGVIHASALVIVDRTALSLCTWDIPRGPLGENENAKMRNETLLKKIVSDAKKDKCIGLYVSPIEPLISHFSFRNSPRHEQPEATRILNLALSDDELLAQMHQKGRYNIKVAQKNDVRIEQSTDIDAYADMAKQTAIRDHYKAAPKKQYEAFLEHLPGSFLLLAYKDKKVIAGLLGVNWGNTGIYYYGASDYDHRALMAPYLLQWEAMHRCREAGCTNYDLLGVAPPDAGSDHPWKGISNFKEKFGGALITYPPEQRITFRPVRRTLLSMKRKMFG